MARYQDAINWIAFNDDTDWLDEEHGSISVTAALVVDLFHKDEKQVIKDIRKAIEIDVLIKEKS